MQAAQITAQFTGTLSAKAPFDYGKTFGFLESFGPTENEQSFENARLIKALTLNGRAVAFEISNAGTVEQPALAYTLYSEQELSEKERAVVEDRIRFFLSLDDDLTPFYNLAQSDPTFAPVVRKLYGLHQPKFLTPFEIACWAVLGQRIPWRVAHRMKMALVERYGTQITLPSGTYPAFPEPAQLAGISQEELFKIVPNERKVEYLQAVIRFFQEIDEGFLRHGDIDAVANKLRAVRGIGEWSSHFILVRGLGRMERVSSLEPEFIKAVSRIYGLGEASVAAKMSEILNHYGDCQGYFAFYCRVATLGSGPTMAQVK